MDGYRYLQTKLGEINDAQILKLLSELETITRLETHACADWSLFNYLAQCIYPNGGPKAVPVTKEELDEHDPLNAFLLRKKVRNLAGSEIYVLCQETTKHFQQGIERFEGKSLYLFINHFYSVLKKKKPPAGKRRWL